MRLAWLDIAKCPCPMCATVKVSGWSEVQGSYRSTRPESEAVTGVTIIPEVERDPGPKRDWPADSEKGELYQQRVGVRVRPMVMIIESECFPERLVGPNGKRRTAARLEETLKGLLRATWVSMAPKA